MLRIWAKWVRRWLAIKLLTLAILGASTVALSMFLPGGGQQALTAATHAACNDAHVPYADPKARLDACLKRMVTKIDQSMAQHGHHNESLSALRALTESN